MHSHFCSKSINVLENTLATTVNKFVIHKIVKLTMLEQVGPDLFVLRFFLPSQPNGVKRIWLCWGLTTRQPFRVILCRLPEKGRKEIEERVEEIKERDREERGTGKKVKKQKK